LPGASLYGASKAVLALLTRSWAAEFGPAGGNVNAIAVSLCRVAAEYVQDRMAGEPVYHVSVEEREHIPLHGFRAAVMHRPLPAISVVLAASAREPVQVGSWTV
jgi:NAD(P)-dependent dehydrogenase (short-subunit alcohol dehydrogenase family)